MKRLALGLWAAALLIGLGSGAASAQSERAGGAPASPEHVVEVVDLEGVIDPTTAAYLESRLDLAASKRSEIVVIRLDTPGGLDVSMRDMVQGILRSPVPVVVWVGPPGARAASAGVFLVYASHVAATAPGTNLGAAHPVDLGGELSVPGHAIMSKAHVERLERELDRINASLPPLTEFVLPGGTRAAALAHAARAICRRAERRVVALSRKQKVAPALCAYLNRLSDLLFVVARKLNRAAGHGDVLWKQGKNR